MNNVCVIGSINMDVVLKVKHMAKLGETIFASSLKNIPGGKGANQAVALARMNENVIMIGRVGKDSTGETLTNELVKDGINVDYVFKDECNPTGTAIITVDEDGNNSIIVASGANMALTDGDIKTASTAIKESDIVISQFEVPIEGIIEGFKIARENNKITILNPAPAKQIGSELLKYVDIIIPNETEAYEITGIMVKDLESAKLAGEKFIKKGVRYVIITLGDKGAALISKEGCEIVPAYKVKAIDTTAAGDSFIGGFASKLSTEDLSYETIRKAILFGNKVSSIVVQREGAQPSIPSLEEVYNIYGED